MIVEVGPQSALETQHLFHLSLAFYFLNKVNGYLLQFKLAPAFGLYMVVKHHLSPEFQIPITSSEGKKNLTLALKTIITQFKKALKVSVVRLLLESGNQRFSTYNWDQLAHISKIHCMHDRNIYLVVGASPRPIDH